MPYGRKLKLKSKKLLGTSAALALVLAFSLIMISSFTSPDNVLHLEPGFFSSGQSVSSHPKDMIYLYPNRNDTNVDGFPSVGFHSHWPNLADQNTSTYDTLTESNTNPSATHTLVPNGETGTEQLYPNPAEKPNWECCNESDDDTSYVFLNKTNTWKMDLYNLEEPPVIEGAIINYVEVCVTVKLHLLSKPTYGIVVPMLYSPSWLLPAQVSTFNVYSDGYVNFSSRWDRNPDTLESWNWSDLEDLQAGVRLRIPKGPDAELRCTFVWVVVNYTVPNYELDLELQWTNVPLTASNSNLCIRTGNFTSNENISVWYWSNGAWRGIISNLQNNTWNNASLKIDSSTLTIRFKGNSENLDRVQDSWEIALAVLVLDYVPPAVSPYFEMFLIAFLLGSGNQPSSSSAALIIGAVTVVSVFGLVVSRFYISGEAASFRRRRLKQLEEARKRIRRALEDVGDGGAS